MAFKSKFWILITLVLAALASLLVYAYLNELKKPPVPEEMTAQILAKVKIPEGAKITQDMVESTAIPAKYVSSSAIKELKDALGKYAVTDILPGSVLVSGILASETDIKELPFKIPKGMRAVSVPVDEVTGVAGLVKPGHRVDLIAVVPDPDDRAKLISITLIQDSLVLAVGPELQKREGVQPASTVTLAVTPEEAQLETLAERTGSVKLSVRPTGEAGKQTLPSADVNRLLRMFP